MKKNSFVLKKHLAFLMIFSLIASMISTAMPMVSKAYQTNSFREDFNGATLDPNKWLVVYKNWGGKANPDDPNSPDYNGGVNPQNVSVSNGTLKLEAHGNLYTDPADKMVKGINKNGSIRSDGKRVGAAIATRDYFSSGKYEVRMKIPSQLGVCSTIWTYHYEEYYPDDSLYIDAKERNVLLKKKDGSDEEYYAVNHEIDIELPGRPGPAKTGMSYDYALCNTWRGEADTEMTTNYVNARNALGYGLADGQFHKYRFDWHTGGNGQPSRVDFYIDDVLIKTSTTNIPTHASRLWLATWFPNTWAGEPVFDKAVMEVDYVDIQPFQEPNDTWQSESYPSDGWLGTNPLPEKAKKPFSSTFTNGLDPSKWLIANKNWGGQLGGTMSYNGGVIPENVKLSSGNLILEAHGDKYNGSIMGLNKSGKASIKKTDGNKAGAAVATNEYYASGRYEVTAKIPQQLGVCSAFWTFHYSEVYEGEPLYEQKLAEGKVLKVKKIENGQVKLVNADYYAINHEIDIELPGRPGPAKTDMSYNYALCNTWIGEADPEYTTYYTDLTPAIGSGKPNGIADGQFHKYRFDWHTGGSGITPRVEFYVDDILVKTSTTNIPNRAGRFWIAAWFPNKWAGNPNFNIAQLEIKEVKITPFNEPNDDYASIEGFSSDGWAPMYQYPGYTFNDDGGQQSIPAIPTGLAATTAGTSQINVSWNPSSGATGYDLLVTKPDSSTQTISNITSPYSHTGLAANTTYKYQVRAKNSAGQSSWSSQVSATTSQPSQSLLMNGDFSNGSSDWVLTGNAKIQNSAAVLDSGSDTDTVEQIVTVLPNTSYVLSADLIPNGVTVDLGVRDYNGRYTDKANHFTVNGNGTLNFTTGPDVTQITVYVQVHRYQANLGPATVDNVRLIKQ